jgi:hypothetical protein
LRSSFRQIVSIRTQIIVDASLTVGTDVKQCPESYFFFHISLYCGAVFP